MTEKPKDLVPVKDLNVNALALKQGGLEEALTELNRIKSRYPDGSPDRIKIEKQILDINSKIAEIEEQRRKDSKKTQTKKTLLEEEGLTILYQKRAILISIQEISVNY
jgi:predicted  nucleic acid-binding Zn-ribbon protein